MTTSEATALFGGAFDPPHNGHVALLQAARAELGVGSAVVIVAASPGHKAVATPAGVRLELARAAFPREDVRLDEHARTIDMLRDHPEWEGTTFLLGADEFVDFPGWKEPEAVLELVQVGVATRPGFERTRLDAVLESLERPDRVAFFDLAPFPIASRELRARLNRGDDVSRLVPRAVWESIERDGLYGRGEPPPHGYTEPS
ncbi:MAG TPA: nicotinate-nicotinamide nucleotide adenylyltransferase [Gaiellaceae bacterium]